MGAAATLAPPAPASPSRERAVDLVGEEVIARLEAAGLVVLGPVLTVTEAASYLVLNPWTVRAMTKAGELPAGRKGHAIRLDRDGVIAWARQGRAPRQEAGRR
jgi:excisionase family DNA binding protein